MFAIDCGTPLRRTSAGFTLIEMMVVVLIISIGMAIGVPAMSRWNQTSQAEAAVEFYAEGLTMARRQALAHNANSRFVLSANTVSGQFDWRVDVCFPTPTVPCTSSSSNWSTPTSAAANDPDPGVRYTSVSRSADALPKHALLTITLVPDGYEDLYFLPTGWVDQSDSKRLGRIEFRGTNATADNIQKSALSVALVGTVSRCNPDLPNTDSRACP